MDVSVAAAEPAFQPAAASLTAAETLRNPTIFLIIVTSVSTPEEGHVRGGL